MREIHNITLSALENGKLAKVKDIISRALVAEYGRNTIVLPEGYSSDPSYPDLDQCICAVCRGSADRSRGGTDSTASREWRRMRGDNVYYMEFLSLRDELGIADKALAVEFGISSRAMTERVTGRAEIKRETILALHHLVAEKRVNTQLALAPQDRRRRK